MLLVTDSRALLREKWGASSAKLCCPTLAIVRTPGGPGHWGVMVCRVGLAGLSENGNKVISQHGRVLALYQTQRQVRIPCTSVTYFVVRGLTTQAEQVGLSYPVSTPTTLLARTKTEDHLVAHLCINTTPQEWTVASSDESPLPGIAQRSLQPAHITDQSEHTGRLHMASPHAGAFCSI